MHNAIIVDNDSFARLHLNPVLTIFMYDQISPHLQSSVEILYLTDCIILSREHRAIVIVITNLINFLSSWIYLNQRISNCWRRTNENGLISSAVGWNSERGQCFEMLWMLIFNDISNSESINQQSFTAFAVVMQQVK